MNIGQRYWVMIHAFKPVSHQPGGSRAPIYDGKFLGFVRQPHGVVNNTARLSYAKQGCKAAATNFRHVHLLCDLFAFSERRHWTKSPIYKSPQTFSKDLEPPRFALFCLYLYLVCMILPYICRYENMMV